MFELRNLKMILIFYYLFLSISVIKYINTSTTASLVSVPQLNFFYLQKILWGFSLAQLTFQKIHGSHETNILNMIWYMKQLLSVT